MDASPRTTISLALIAKNEEKNINRLLDSVEGCFDEIVLVDTGSTDKTVEIAEKRGCKVSHFEWVDDFSKARNFAFSQCSKDYIMWIDLDDILFGKENFIKWRDHAMQFVEYWFNSYHYAVDKDLNPQISFVRERVFRRSINPTWSYPIHEGVLPKAEWSKNYATTWCVKHRRDAEDMNQDRSRNIRMMEKMAKAGPLDPRMQFYYGKELYEANRAAEAIPELDKALTLSLESHDRLLAIQYGGYSSLRCFDDLKPEATEERQRYLNKALDFAHQGIRLEPTRAEFHVLAADAYLRANNLGAAVPYFSAAKGCLKNFNTPYDQALYSFKNLYGEAPSLQLAKIYAHVGLLDKAKKEAQECVDAYNNEDAKAVIAELDRITKLVTVSQDQMQTEDIIFTCPPHQAYPFDEEIYKTQALGGSETALVQMARLLREKTGRTVKVFNLRESKLVAESGVEYVPSGELNAYLCKFKPRVHIAWRHNIKLTDAPTYLWCHDLFTPGCEVAHNFDKILCLSAFHKNYVMGLQGIPESKVIVTRNGIDKKKFHFVSKKKNPMKVVWMSSPDRGLERAIQIIDEVRKEFPVELHVYYGIEGLYKYGPQMSALADKLKGMMESRPYVKYHGFTEQKKMYEEVSDAVIWNHPNDFIETFCITALECLANGIFPIARRLGALANTLGEAAEKREAILLDYDYKDVDESIKLHKDAICRVILNRQWENVSFDFDHHDWTTISEEWIEFLGLKHKVEAVTA